jgi:hypothetical protein
MTELSRRSLLATGAVGAALAPFLGGEAAQAAKPRVAYSRARFLPHRRKRVRVSGPGGRWTARLLEVADLSRAQTGDDQAFGLVFRAQRRGPEQGSFTVRRHRFAPLELFLVPTDSRRRTYYAVVNRTS